MDIQHSLMQILLCCQTEPERARASERIAWHSARGPEAECP